MKYWCLQQFVHDLFYNCFLYTLTKWRLKPWVFFFFKWNFLRKIKDFSVCFGAIECSRIPQRKWVKTLFMIKFEKIQYSRGYKRRFHFSMFTLNYYKIVSVIYCFEYQKGALVNELWVINQLIALKKRKTRSLLIQ